MRFRLTREVPDLDVEYSTPMSIDFGKQYVSLGPAAEALNRMRQYICNMVVPNMAHFFEAA